MKDHQFEIKNWKLKEVINQIEVIDTQPLQFIIEKLHELHIPLKYNKSINRGESFVDWDLMEVHNKFFFDNDGWEDKIKSYFLRSNFKKSTYLIIAYCQDNLVVKIPYRLFVEDWEGFVRSTLYNTLIFSEDYEMFMEVTRDYFIHSNFLIKDD